MSLPQPALSGERPLEPPWYTHNRYEDLLSPAENLAEKLAATEARAGVARGVVKVADREQVGGHESPYLRPAAPPRSGYRTRDGQPRIMRRDRSPSWAQPRGHHRLTPSSQTQGPHPGPRDREPDDAGTPRDPRR